MLTILAESGDEEEGDEAEDDTEYIFCFFDIEVVTSQRSKDGIVQLGAKLVNNNGDRLGGGSSPNGAFVRFVKPAADCTWNPHCTAVHKIQPHQVASAPPIQIVLEDLIAWLTDWQQFLSSALPQSASGISIKFCLTGHNIVSCDLDWFFAIMVRHAIRLPEFIDAYWDTYLAIKDKKTNQLHPHAWAAAHTVQDSGNASISASGLSQHAFTTAQPGQQEQMASSTYSPAENTLSMSSLYSKLTGQAPPANAHNVSVDIDMNITVATHNCFWRYREQKGAGRKLLANVWRAKALKALKLLDDLHTPIPNGWKEVGEAPDNPEDTYTGGKFGPKAGTPAADLEPDSLVTVFVAYLTLEELRRIAQCSTYYATEQPVKKVLNARNRVVRFEVCAADAAGATTRCPLDSWQGMTPGSIMCFIGVSYLMGVYQVRNAHDPWDTDVNRRIPAIADSMREEVYLQHLHFLHFSDCQQEAAASGPDAKNPLRKIAPLLTALAKTFGNLWTAGMRVVVDESSIACKSHLSLVQYNSQKIHKHHIKFFALCCAHTGVALGLHPYAGKKHHQYDPNLGLTVDLIVNKLLPHLPEGLSLNNHVLYADNWYTNLHVARGLALHANMRLVGTAKGPHKPPKNRTIDTMPFHVPQCSSSLPRGWLRQAELVTPIPTSPMNPIVDSYRCATTIYKDRKTFFIVHTAYVQKPEAGDIAMRGAVGRGRTRKPQPSFRAHLEYNAHYGGVDMMDQGTGAYHIPTSTKRWYMRVVFWLLDVIAYNLWQIAQAHVSSKTSKFYSQFKEGSSRRCAHENFQEQLGKDLLKAGLRLAAEEQHDSVAPQRLRTPQLYRSYANELRPDHDSESGSSKRARGSSDAVGAIHEPPAWPVEGPGTTVEDPEPAVQLMDTGEHAIISFCVKNRCAGCRAILQRLKKFEPGDETDFTPHTTRKGCAACHEHLCDKCVSIWSHEWASIPLLPPAGYESWSHYVHTR